MANHIIHKQTFNLRVASEEQAHGVREAVQQAFNDKVLIAMDEVFSRLSPDDKIYRFDRLEIDLGSIEPQNIETELVEKITSMAGQLIREKISAYPFDAGEKNGMEALPATQSVFEAFVDFLQTGLLPWWFSDHKNKSPEVLFGEIAKQLDPVKAHKLKSILGHQTAFTRLNVQFSDKFADELIQVISSLISGKTISDLNKKDTEYSSLISILITEILSALKKNNISEKLIKEVRIALLELMPFHNIAYKTIPAHRSEESLTPEFNNIIAECFKKMVDVLDHQGFNQQDIKKLLGDFEKVLPENTYSGFWLKAHKNEFHNIETFQAKKPEKQASNKLDKKENIDTKNKIEKLAQDGIYIQNAGLVLLWPFLKHYFTQLKLVENDAFLSDEKKERAVLLLQYISSGTSEFPEQQLALNKLLCGLPLHHPVANKLHLTKMEIHESDKLIKAAIEKWKGIGKVSIQGFRNSFLEREGRLKISDSSWVLTINRKAWDLLIDRLPWSISMVKYKWMDRMIQVEW